MTADQTIAASSCWRHVIGRFAGKSAARHSIVSGAIRAGHDVATRQRILRELSQAWTRLTGQSEELLT